MGCKYLSRLPTWLYADANMAVTFVPMSFTSHCDGVTNSYVMFPPTPSRIVRKSQDRECGQTQIPTWSYTQPMRIMDSFTFYFAKPPDHISLSQCVAFWPVLKNNLPVNGRVLNAGS
ncbi:uncharacterized protein B0H18DRAFT_28111 [Fomitopsis serialis]|uniref:uncharacterized protein n=1 Tax=Fomitopsis serialis TaxID=139415 RepID=UPI002008BD2B|nr:uncharacterized protein B0H18DRAFT_28111 [Neoantrodia serialis]KAH9932523.1 hypothetical protein B0H18DRAFT_28111 [Neoantrodia serialis]